MGGVSREPSPHEAEDSGCPTPSRVRAFSSRSDGGLGMDGRSRESGLAGRDPGRVWGIAVREISSQHC